MKTAKRRWLAAGAMVALAGPAWADLAQWVGCEITIPPTGCQPGDWAYSSNWFRKGIAGQPATLGPPLAGDVVRVAPDSYGTTTINFVDTKSFILNGNPATPIFESLSIQGVAVNHSGAADSMRTVTLNIGDGGKYTMDSRYGGVGIGGTTGSDGRSSAIIGALGGSASFEHLGAGFVAVGAITVPNNLVLGQDAGSVGRYVMGPGAGTLYLGYTDAAGKAGSTIVGQGGDGIFEQGGGRHVTGTLVLGQNAADTTNGIPAATGIYTLSGGYLEARDAGASMQVGLGGAGTFNQNGGSVATQGVTLGVASGSTGTYALTGGMIGGLSDPSLGGPLVAIVVGEAGGGAFTQDGGEVLASSLVLGRQAGATGTYGVSNGRLDVRGNVVVGDSGTGQLDVSGGQFSVDGNVVVAAQAGSTGTLNVSGGFLGAANINVNAGGTLNYSGGQIDLYPDQFGTLGSLVNGIGGEVYISGTSVITGNVVNDGKIKVTDATVFYTGTYTGSGVYESDPSFNYFMSDLVLTETGYLVGGSGDVFQIGGGFLNASTNASQWNTDLASLVFSGMRDHRFGVAAGVGALAFGWGGIRTDPGARLSFYDSVVDNNGMALYVGILELADGLNAILLDPDELLTIYFDQSKRENAYLLAALETGRVPAGLKLVAYGAPTPSVPEAPTLPLLVIGLAGLATASRRRARA